MEAALCDSVEGNGNKGPVRVTLVNRDEYVIKKFSENIFFLTTSSHTVLDCAAFKAGAKSIRTLRVFGPF
ncbi:hypothetical protein OUZ56_018765 [Daphnia magna]|uniref:Uncharacterized protein n=1 Tax=Daphnia magna TaxID=35525 RepID=A0ABQ9Z9R5_9CRUS|nr:hypothetical protein OUZ56_018765 [Daphnia magna]